MIDYGHGDDTHKYNSIRFKANFSSNVWYNGAPKTLLKHLEKKLKTIEHYPAPSAERLTKEIETHHSLPPKTTLVTNGATEAFYTIANAFHSSSVTLCTPSFSEYEHASKANNLECHYIDRQAVSQHQFKTALAYICNPNNPDGVENTPDEIDRIAEKHPDTIFIIDEAYTEFTTRMISCVALLKQRPNIIVVKSLTKLFCIPGLRLGYLIANPRLISKIMRYKMPWNVNTMAIHAGDYIFAHYRELVPDFTPCFKTAKELKYAIDALNGFEVIPTNTTYFLIKLKTPRAAELKAYLIDQHQVLIRDASNFRTLDEHYIRVSSQTPEKNAVLLKALEQWQH